MLEPSAIKDAGVESKERIVLKVTAEGQIGSHIVLWAKSNELNPLAGDAQAFWFPNRAVKLGDSVVLYTKSGTPKKKTTGDNETHFFYWGATGTLWDKPDRAACVGNFKGWTSLRLMGFAEEEDVEPADPVTTPS